MESSTINITNSTNRSQEYVNVVDIPDITFPIFYILIGTGTFAFALISLIFNVLSIYVIVSSHLCYKFSYVLILNLSVCDALLAITVISTLSMNVYLITAPTNILDVFWVLLFVDYLFNIFSIASLLTVLLMSFELFFMVKYPLKHLRIFKQMRVKTATCIIVIVWVTSVLPGCINFIMFIVNLSTMSVAELFDPTQAYYQWITIILAVLGFLTILLLNSAVLRIIYASHLKNPRERQTMKKATITVCLIITMYFLFYLPFWINTGIIIFDYLRNSAFDLTFMQFYFLTLMFLVVNTVCDPLIYAFRIPKIRKGFRKRLCKSGCYRNGTSNKHESTCEETC